MCVCVDGRADGRIDIATGHYGSIKDKFLVQMARTLRRLSPGDGACGDGIGMAFLYHPSRQAILERDTNSFAVLRTTAPAQDSGKKILDTHFFEARPKFDRDGAQRGLIPILHGKAMLATSADGKCAVMFAGSQNFSKASWGDGEQQPTNIEIGVVVKACTRKDVDDLRERFPIQLAPNEDFGLPAHERAYIMSRGPSDGNSVQGSEGGLQGRWRARCNDLKWLAAWRMFLFAFWNICSRCGGASTAPLSLSVAGMEARAAQGDPFLCGKCKTDEEHGRKDL